MVSEEFTAICTTLKFWILFSVFFIFLYLLALQRVELFMQLIFVYFKFRLFRGVGPPSLQLNIPYFLPTNWMLIVLWTDNLVLGTYHSVLGTYNLALRTLCTYNLVLRTCHSVLCVDNLVFCTSHSVLCTDNLILCNDTQYFHR